MRRMLGVLRDGTSPADGPQNAEDSLTTPPTLRHLDQLLATVPQEIAVDINASGDLNVLPASVDTTAFRIVQEAVTNMIKHSDAQRLAVTVAVRSDALTLQVQNDGVPRAATGPAGFGIIGMRERVAAFGGTFSARPQPESGFLVTAQLPLQEQA